VIALFWIVRSMSAHKEGVEPFGAGILCAEGSWESMTEEAQSLKTGWTATQAYVLSIICLVVGVALGYLYRGSAPQTVTSSSPAAVSQAQMPPQMGIMPQSAGGMSGGQPSADQLRQMADKKVAPLLDELKKNPKDTETLTKVGTFYMVAGQYDEAAKYFQQSVDVKPTADAWTKLSNAQAYGGSGDQAIESLNKALKVDPKFANALYNLGMLKWRVQGDVKGAIACWETLVRTNPKHPQIAKVKEMIVRAKEHENMPAGTKTNKPTM
jgi:cytochrome c-type biogenesis protein CcmH/NrfG